MGDIMPGGDNLKGGSVITGHQLRLERMDSFVKPQTQIKLQFFMRMTVQFPMKNKKTGKDQLKRVQIVVFN